MKDLLQIYFVSLGERRIWSILIMSCLNPDEITKDRIETYILVPLHGNSLTVRHLSETGYGSNTKISHFISRLL